MPKVELENQFESPWRDYKMFNRTADGKPYITGYRISDGKQLRRNEYQKKIWEDKHIPNSIADLNKLAEDEKFPLYGAEWMKYYMRGSRGNKNPKRLGYYKGGGSRQQPKKRFPDSKFQGYGGKIKKSDKKKIEEHKQSEKDATKLQKKKHKEQGEVNKIIEDIIDAPKVAAAKKEKKPSVVAEDEKDPLILAKEDIKNLTDKQKTILKKWRAEKGAVVKADKKQKKKEKEEEDEKKAEAKEKSEYQEKHFNPFKKLRDANKELLKDFYGVGSNEYKNMFAVSDYPYKPSGGQLYSSPGYDDGSGRIKLLTEKIQKIVKREKDKKDEKAKVAKAAKDAKEKVKAGNVSKLAKGKADKLAKITKEKEDKEIDKKAIESGKEKAKEKISKFVKKKKDEKEKTISSFAKSGKKELDAIIKIQSLVRKKKAIEKYYEKYYEDENYESNGGWFAEYEKAQKQEQIHKGNKNKLKTEIRKSKARLAQYKKEGNKKKITKYEKIIKKEEAELKDEKQKEGAEGYLADTLLKENRPD